METLTPEKKPLAVHETEIPGLLVVDLVVNEDNRGTFKENYQKEKMVKLGIPEDFNIVQNNITDNFERGAVRGIHAEPWDKYVSVGYGKVFGVWVDLREGENFGKVFSTIIDPSKAVFVPRGVANALQSLDDHAIYTYLVNAHWSEEAQKDYKYVNIADPTLNIPWPIPLSESEISEKDINHPMLADVKPMEPLRTLVTGGNGQLGRALKNLLSNADFTTRKDFDLGKGNLESQIKDWHKYDTIINAGAYTAVDDAETPEGREKCWKVNATTVAELGRIAIKYNLKFVNVSSEYVFDGKTKVHTEEEPLTPLGVYGQTKAAGDVTTSIVPKHYTIRTTGVFGDGKNFVKTMSNLAKKDFSPKVVKNQIGRPTHVDDLAAGIKHLLDVKAPYGTYNISSDGKPASWAEVAKLVYELSGKDPGLVKPVTAIQYYAGQKFISKRPKYSTLDLTKIKSTGFKPSDWRESLKKYLTESEKAS